MKNQVIWALMIVFAGSSGSALAEKKEKPKHPVLGHRMKALDGKEVDLAKFKGKVLLIVNTASECGATPQYEPLQTLHEKYSKQGLVVAGFPCNQFGAQEPGTDKEITAFCKENYGVTFPMFSKVDVNGKKAAPLFRFLTSKKTGLKEKDTGPVRWNFEKFLVSREGKVLARFRTSVEPDSTEVVKAIETALDKK